RATGSRNPPPRVILPETGLVAGSRNPPPSVILLVTGRRKPPPRRMRPLSVVVVFMEDSNLNICRGFVWKREGCVSRIASSGWRIPRNQRSVRVVALTQQSLE